MNDPGIDLHPGKAQEIAAAMGITLEQAKALIQKAATDPVGFQKNQQLISQIKQIDDRELKGIQLRHTKAPVRRNDPCPCGCGKKFKNCDTFRKDRTIGVIVHRKKSND